ALEAVAHGELPGGMTDADVEALLAAVKLQLGDVRAALAHAERAVAIAGSDGVRANAFGLLALVRAAVGLSDAALEAAGEVDAISQATYLDRTTAAWGRGFALLHLGRPEEADACLAAAVAMVDATGD